MPIRLPASCLCALLITGIALGSESEPARILRMHGAPTVNRVVVRAAQVLRSEDDVEVQIGTEGGSAGGIAALGDGLAQIALSSRPVTPEERAEAPDVRFNQIYIGEHIVALVVSSDVWESGIRSLSRQDMLSIYEGRIDNWKELGGEDRRITFFNSEPGRGTWEIFAQWLYGDAKLARSVRFPTVANDEDTLNSVAFTRGSLSQLSAGFADDKTVYAIGMRDDSGRIIKPTPRNAAMQAYPMSRPLYLIVNDRPTGLVKVMVDLMLGLRGQEFIRKEGYFTKDDMEAAAPRNPRPEFEILPP